MTDFEDHRGRLLGIAYRLLGSFADAEDIVQETWIAWQKVDHDRVDHPGAYLDRTVTHGALNRLRAMRRRREEYIGTWLPEPVATERLPEESAELADSVSFAMLVLLERLSPLERAAFILRDVFDLRTDEVAATLDRSPAAVRKLVSRARGRLAANPTDLHSDPVEHTRTSMAFVGAVQSGDVHTALALLSPSVQLVADGGGKASAVRRPVIGADNVLRFLMGALEKWGVDSIEPISVNHLPALLIDSADQGLSVYQLQVRGGRIEQLWAMRNPDKLAGFTSPRADGEQERS